MTIDDGSNKAVIENFLTRLARASAAVLLLDYDGTLAPFQTDRSHAYPYPGVLPVLGRILQSGRTMVCVISGRPVSEILALLHPLSDIEIWGAHGLEHRLANGVYQRAEIDSDTADALAQAEQWLRETGLLHMAEIKPGGIALHWRGLPAAEVERVQTRTCEGWSKLAGANPGVKLLDFDGGLELRAKRPDKGDAVAAILDGAEQHAPVAFLGDDFTDEDAFRILDGRGLSILVRPEYRETHAKAWLRPSHELLDFLERWSTISNNSSGIGRGC